MYALAGTAAARRLLLAAAMLLVTWAQAGAEPPLGQSLERIRQEWAIAISALPANKRGEVLDTLGHMAHQVALRFPARPEPMVWEGIVLAAYAETRGPVLGYFAARRARELLLKAERLAPGSAGGLGYATLGMLYACALPWPFSFGDVATSHEYLERGLAALPDATETNLLHGEFVLTRADYPGAARSLRKALAAPLGANPSRAAASARSQTLHLVAMAEACG